MSRWDQGKWWDADSSDPTGNPPRCDHCVTKPKLVPSGESEPKNLKCPICKQLFDTKGKKFDAAAYAIAIKARKSKLMTDEEEAWEGIWGSTQPQTFCKTVYCVARFTEPRE